MNYCINAVSAEQFRQVYGAVDFGNGEPAMMSHSDSDN